MVITGDFNIEADAPGQSHGAPLAGRHSRDGGGHAGGRDAAIGRATSLDRVSLALPRSAWSCHRARFEPAGEAQGVLRSGTLGSGAEAGTSRDRAQPASRCGLGGPNGRSRRRILRKTPGAARAPHRSVVRGGAAGSDGHLSQMARRRNCPRRRRRASGPAARNAPQGMRTRAVAWRFASHAPDRNTSVATAARCNALWRTISRSTLQRHRGMA